MTSPEWRIDLNCDLGEVDHPGQLESDLRLLELVSSANIACGGHAGSPEVMAEVLAACRRLGIRAGAHPGYPDRAGFGRTSPGALPEQIHDWVAEQVAALLAVADRVGLSLSHVKPHGALYNDAHHDEAIARAIVDAVSRTVPGLVLFGPPGSALARAAGLAGLPFCAEGFADRRYLPDGSLVPRSRADALLLEPAEAAAQFVQIATTSTVTAEREIIPLKVDTICVHGDHPWAEAVLLAIGEQAAARGIQIIGPRL